MTERNDSTMESSRMLHIALELGGSRWMLASADGSARKPRSKVIAAGDLSAMRAELRAARKHFKLAADAAVRSCYEAGRDGFWVHRALTEMGVESLVVDSSSIEVNRRHRRAKTDRLDVRKLLKLLLRYGQGEHDVFSIVRAPSTADEALRRPQRELHRLTREATALTNRIKGLLKTQGVALAGGMNALDFEALRCWNHQPLPDALRLELQRTHQRWQLLQLQIRELETESRRQLQRADTKAAKVAATLLTIRGVGERISWSLATELFAWRDFRNGRQVGALLGMTATPYRSDGISREQGISKAGNPRLRALMTQAAWLWLRHQPESHLSRWFRERFGQSGRSKRVGIIALARKLTIALWRFAEHGQLPHGAVLKTTH